jgi:hypothetical protein
MYTTNSSFLSVPTGNPQAWADAIRPHNPTQAGAIAAAYFIYGAQIGINADLAIAQGCHESAWFTSAHWVNQFNSCGLGVTGPGVPGATFAGIDEGVKAHYEHLVCYAMTADPPVIAQWGMLDPRHFMHVGHPEISYLDGRWAVPGVGYSASIAAIANQVTGGVTPVSNVPTAADLGYPGHVHYATGSGESMNLAAVRWFIVHDTEGHFAGDEATLSGQISAHLLIDKTGEWRFMVPLDTVAYAAGNLPVNRQSINVENSGFVDGHDGGYTDAQYRCCAAFYRFCVANGMTGVPATYIGKQDANSGPEPDVAGILGHMDVPRDDGQPGWGGNYGHQDPGPLYDFGKLIALIGNAPLPPAPPPDPDVLTITRPDGTSFDVAYGFLHNLYEDVSEPKRLLHFGYPESNDVAAQVTDADGTKWQGRAQFWERAVFLHDPRNPPGIWQDYIAREDQMVTQIPEAH